MDDKFIKSNSITDGKGETEEVTWITSNGTHIPIREGQTKDEAFEKFFKPSLKNEGEGDIIWLSSGEYKAICSAIKTRYKNNIPKKGEYFGRDYYYIYTCENGEMILCRFKISIDSNKDEIEYWRKKYGIK